MICVIFTLFFNTGYADKSNLQSTSSGAVFGGPAKSVPVPGSFPPFSQSNQLSEQYPYNPNR